ncbi:hypothetical protein BsWGS_18005 [Bradybaena similaris]
MDRSVNRSDVTPQQSTGKADLNENKRRENISTNDDPVIRILEIEAKIDKKPIQVDDGSSAGLKYRTSNFTASATVEISPFSKNESWEVGWIQASTRWNFFNTYRKQGYTSWECPQLTLDQQSMICDCNGQHFPWYGSDQETVVFKGPCVSYRTARVFMNDRSNLRVSWVNPAQKRSFEKTLNHVINEQSFYLWLVAWNLDTGKRFVLQSISWERKLDMDINPNRRLGKRANIQSGEPRQPIILDHIVDIPECVLTPPSAECAQMLVWISLSGETCGQTECLIAPAACQSASPKREVKV